MHIGINTSFLRKPGTGIGQVTTNLVRELVKITKRTSITDAPHEFFLYCEEDPILDFPIPENFHIRVFLPFWKRDDTLREMLWEKKLVKYALKDGCEVFLSTYQSASIFPRSIHHSMIVHDIIPRLFPMYLENMKQCFFWWNKERGIRKAENIITVSECTKRDIMRELHIQEKKITVIPIDTDPRFLMPISKEREEEILKKYHLKSGYIYHGGGLEIRKNTETLLRVYKHLIEDTEWKKRLPKLVISGKIFNETNVLATNVKRIIRELHLEDSVVLLGFVPDEDIPALYFGALFFVYPSLYEGFGLPVLEALRMGIPVLSSENSSLMEVGGDAVLYTDPRDLNAMESQMKRLITDRSLREMLIARSSTQALSFNWERSIHRLLVVLLKK